MSITPESLQLHLKDPAVFCCRREKGLVISAADLEDPGLFEDMVEAGLLELKEDGLKIEQVLGSTLTSDVEALTSITRDVLDKVNDVSADTTEEKSGETPLSVAEPVLQIKETGGKSMIHIEIGKAEKLEGLSLDIPVLTGGVSAGETAVAAPVWEKEEAAAGKKKMSFTADLQRPYDRSRGWLGCRHHDTPRTCAKMFRLRGSDGFRRRPSRRWFFRSGQSPARLRRV